MVKPDVRKIVNETIKQIAKEQSKPVPNNIEGSQSIVEDLGLSSLDVATLVSLLETSLNVDPFATGVASITDIRTVDELCEAYEKCL